MANSKIDSLIKDYKTGKYSAEELREKYGFKSRQSVYGHVYDARKNGTLPAHPMNKPVSQKVKQTEKFHKKRNTPLINTSGYRNVTFPGGFSIQIAKNSLTRLVIHEHGDVTIIKD